jgi:hypothetical protein
MRNDVQHFILMLGRLPEEKTALLLLYLGARR